MPAERITVSIPESPQPTRIEVHYNGEMNRWSGVQGGTTELKIKLPTGATLEDCIIRVIPCDDCMNPITKGYIFQAGHLVPYREGMLDNLPVIEKVVKEINLSDDSEESDEGDRCGEVACEDAPEVACEDAPEVACEDDCYCENDEVVTSDEASVVLERPEVVEFDNRQ